MFIVPDTPFLHKQLAMLDVFYLATTPQLLNGAWVEENGQEKFAQGKTGIIAQQASPYLIRDLKELWQKYDHDIEFKDAVTVIAPWANEAGEQLSFAQTTFWSESYFNTDMSDIEMERAMMLYDYFLSQEWRDIKEYGLEGVDYEKDGYTINIIREKTEEGTFIAIEKKYPSMMVLSTLGAWDNDSKLIDTPLNRATFGDDIMDMVTEYGKYTQEKVKPMPTNFDIKLLLHPAKSKIDGIPYSDDLVRLIMTEGNLT